MRPSVSTGQWHIVLAGGYDAGLAYGHRCPQGMLRGARVGGV